jgi:GNAT superfamily N-acetyltransferase
VRVRPADAADLPKLAAVERSAARRFAGTHMAFAVDAPTSAPERLRAALARGHLWVAADGERVAGFLMAAPQGGDLFVEEVSVALEEQGRGIGTRLLQAAAETARRAGLAGLTLTTDRTLPWNAPFYARRGFVLLERPGWALQERLDAEAAHGLDPDRRCALRLDFSCRRPSSRTSA